MDPFKVGDVKDLFSTDLERLLTLSQEGLRRLSQQKNPSRREIEELLRHAHTLKGLAATVHGWGLSCWGADLERLYELALTQGPQSSAVTHEVFQFVLEHLEEWRLLNGLTIKESMEDAWECYLRLRTLLDQKWPQQLTALADHEASKSANKQESVSSVAKSSTASSKSARHTHIQSTPSVNPRRPNNNSLGDTPLSSVGVRSEDRSRQRSRLPKLSPPPLVGSSEIPKPPSSAASSAKAGSLPDKDQNPLPRLIAPVIKVQSSTTTPARADFSEFRKRPLETTKPSANPTVRVSMIPFFIRDAEREMDAIAEALQTWTSGKPSSEDLLTIQRSFHTLKGAAQTTGLSKLTETLHSFESFLHKPINTSAPSDTEFVEKVQSITDALARYLHQLKSDPSATWEQISQRHATASISDESPATNPSRNRIRSSQSIGSALQECVAIPNRVDSILNSLQGIHQSLAERTRLLSELAQTLPPQRTPLSSVDREQEVRPSASSASAKELVSRLSNEFDQLNAAFAKGLDTLALESARLRQFSQSILATPSHSGWESVATLQPRLLRVFEDALRLERKEAALALEGVDIRVQAHLLQRLFSPLMHLIRNAVAHGIETPDRRMASGKSKQGQVRLRVQSNSQGLRLELADDGAGIDPEVVRQRAIERGWISELTESLTQDQVLEFILKPGFSTAPQVTSVAGRGIGLDVVRKEVESLKGSLRFTSSLGRGTTWTLDLPAPQSE